MPGARSRGSDAPSRRRRSRRRMRRARAAGRTGLAPLEVLAYAHTIYATAPPMRKTESTDTTHAFRFCSNHAQNAWAPSVTWGLAGLTHPRVVVLRCQLLMVCSTC